MKANVVEYKEILLSVCYKEFLMWKQKYISISIRNNVKYIAIITVY
jgi:hypothetical protein